MGFVLVALVVALGTGCSQDVGDQGEPDRGPIDDAHSGWIDSFNVGDTFTNGYLIVANTGSVPLTILSLAPNFRGDGADRLEYLGAKALDGDRRWAYFDRKPGWPTTSRQDSVHDLGSVPLLPASDLKDERFDGNAYLMGYRVVAGGRSEVESVTVTYTDGKTTWSDDVHLAMTICVPESFECQVSDDP